MSIKKTHEMFVNEVKEMYGDEFTVLSEYRKAKEKVKFRHECGTEFEASPTNILTGHAKCPRCAKKKKYSYEDMVKIFQDHDATLLSKDFNGVYDKVEFICNKHLDKGIQTTTYSKAIYREGCCKYCGYERSSKKQLMDVPIEKMQKDFDEKNLILLEHEYKGVKARYLCSCKNHPNHQFYIIYDNLKYRSNIGCDKCIDLYIESSGEKRIRKFLEKNKIKYIPQKSFDGLIGLKGGNLSYDFFLPKFNLLIEYQGAQHERYIDYFCCGDYSIFLKQQEHDRRKRQYCKDNNYKLLEIWYFDREKIEEILTNALLKDEVFFL